MPANCCFYLRENKIIFDDNNINIPFPQVTVSYNQGNEESKISLKDKKVAESFVEEQKDLSYDIENKSNKERRKKV